MSSDQDAALVVDASISAAWFLPDEATAFTESVLEATATADIWVPTLWVFEMTNLLLSAQRRRRIDAVKRRELITAASALRLKVDREPVTLLELDAIASRHALSAYDAAYLELAMRRRLPIATLDQALQRAMNDAGIPHARIGRPDRQPSACRARPRSSGSAVADGSAG